MKYYKVVAKNPNCGELLSALFGPLEKNCTRYVPENWVKPNKGCGPLCVFNSEEEAHGFMNPTANELWECEIIASLERHVWAQPGKKHRMPLSEYYHTVTTLAKAVKLTTPVFTAESVQAFCKYLRKVAHVDFFGSMIVLDMDWAVYAEHLKTWIARTDEDQTLGKI